MNPGNALRIAIAAPLLLTGLALADSAAAAPIGLEPGYAAVRPISSDGTDAHAERRLTAPVTEHVSAGRNVVCWEYGRFVRPVGFGSRASAVWLRLYGDAESWVPRARVYYINDDRPPHC